VRKSDERVERGCVMGGRSAGRRSLLGFKPLRWVGIDLRYDGGGEVSGYLRVEIRLRSGGRWARLRMMGRGVGEYNIRKGFCDCKM
jgi:hypothetical protein